METAAVVTFTTAPNFGALVQALATTRELEATHGLKVVHIDPSPAHFYNKSIWKPYGVVMRLRSRAFRADRATLGLREVILGKEAAAPALLQREGADAVFVGSDQVLNPRALYERDPARTILPSVTTLPKFGLAMSAFAEQDMETFAPGHIKALEGFARLSFREPWLADYFRAKYGLESSILPDPSFLFTQAELKRLVTGVRAPAHRAGRAVFVGYGMRHWVPDLRSEIAASDAHFININWREARQFGLSLDGPLRLLARLDCGDTVVSNSFHFTALGLLLGKTVAVPSNPAFDGGPRMQNLRRKLDFQPSGDGHELCMPSAERTAILAGMRDELKTYIAECVARI